MNKLLYNDAISERWQVLLEVCKATHDHLMGPRCDVLVLRVLHLYLSTNLSVLARSVSGAEPAPPACVRPTCADLVDLGDKIEQCVRYMY